MSDDDAPNDIGRALIDGALTAFRSNKGWADKAIAQLSDDKLHVALDPNTNCIAAIMKHVAGNLLSRGTDFLTTDGEKPWRNRTTSSWTSSLHGTSWLTAATTSGRSSSSPASWRATTGPQSRFPVATTSGRSSSSPASWRAK